LRELVALWKKELHSYFVSPIAYIVIAVFAILMGYFFYTYLVSFASACLITAQQAQMQMMAPPGMSVNEWVIRPIFYHVSIVLVFLMPLVSMRLVSEERKSGTIQLLLTSPVSDVQIVLAKYLAGLTLYLVLLGVTVVYHVLIFWVGSPEVGPIFSGYLGLLLLGGALLAAGLLISSLTENQIVAAAASFGIFLLLWVIGWTSEYTGQFLGRILEYVSLVEHFEDFAKGVIDTQHIVFYLSFIFLALYLSVRSFEVMRWKG